MSSNWADAPDIEALLPNSLSPITLPKGWTVAGSEPLTILSPERDLRCTFLVRPFTGTAEEISTAAWCEVNPAFTYPVLAKGEMPSTEGWDKVFQVVYDIPSAESRTVFAILRTLSGAAYVILADGSKAALSRRAAQLSETKELWKPTGFTTVNLATRKQPDWGSEQSLQLTQFIQEEMQRFLIPGVSIAVVQKGELVLAEGFGVRSLGNPARITSSTRFMIGSSTKPLTTLMMARLIDQGAFAWTTPVTDLLPNFRLADSDMTAKLQMRHTVCACTGMPRRDADFLFRFEGISPEERLAEMATMRPTTGFGETFQYSNLLVAVGGYAAASSFAPELGLQSAYEAAMRSLVFEPLGMNDSFLARNEACNGDYACPHSTDFDERCASIDLKMEGTVESVAPAGGAWSTVEDMARYLLLELNDGETHNGEQIVSKENLRSRWRGGIKINEKLGYGLGLLHSEEQGLEVLSHGGNTLGFTSDLFFLPEQNLGVVVLTNLRIANAFLAAVRQRVFEILFGAELKAEEMISAALKTKHDSAVRIRDRVKTDPASITWISEFVGRYESSDLGPASIAKTGDAYSVQFQSWGSALGTEAQRDGARLIALASPPWNGAFKFQTDAGTGDLILDAGQMKYKFQRQQN